MCNFIVFLTMLERLRLLLLFIISPALGEVRDERSVMCADRLNIS